LATKRDEVFGVDQQGSVEKAVSIEYCPASTSSKVLEPYE
jgi:hypothetical protein